VKCIWQNLIAKNLVLNLQISLRWFLKQAVSTVEKSFNRERLQLNLDIFNWELTEEEQQKISTIPQQKRVGIEFMLTKDGSLNSVDTADVDVVQV
jgi:3''-deamino-3''-oxonicotianamine reductase